MAVDGDAASFCEVLYPQLVGALTLYCGRRDVAEEIAQETLVRVWDRWPKVRDMASPKGWAHRVAINLANSRYRRLAAERRATARLQQERPGADPDRDADLALRAAVAALPARQRAVVVLRFFADQPVEETARLLHCAPGTVKSLTSKAIDRLRRSGVTENIEVLHG
jgi:RNA polymerase sigma factor (sigma-70 family)